MALKRKRVEDLAGVLEYLCLHEMKPTTVRVITGEQILEWIRVAFHFGKDIGERTARKDSEE